MVHTLRPTAERTCTSLGENEEVRRFWLSEATGFSSVEKEGCCLAYGHRLSCL